MYIYIYVYIYTKNIDVTSNVSCAFHKEDGRKERQPLRAAPRPTLLLEGILSVSQRSISGSGAPSTNHRHPASTALGSVMERSVFIARASSGTVRVLHSRKRGKFCERRVNPIVCVRACVCEKAHNSAREKERASS